MKQGHRVRIATHEDFRSFVTENKLEFYNIGGDPKELMSYMVRSKHPIMRIRVCDFRLIGVTDPGLMPGFESLTNGDIGRKRKMLGEILCGCWDACTQSDPEESQPFVADAIISNPPAFAHVHCAEALGIPLQMSFSGYSKRVWNIRHSHCKFEAMPWSPTTSFPHPLVKILRSNAEEGLTNYLSYAVAELMTWQG